jgi:formate dehydrogenase maturation protein FdhE|tara:strand:- start:130 stop:315 length:186 start_codon:yes stop_codon:yes gene_type:complete
VKCWHCETELIWGGDHDTEEDDEEFAMVTNLSCPSCNSHVDVYLPKDKEFFKELNDQETVN